MTDFKAEDFIKEMFNPFNRRFDKVMRLYSGTTEQFIEDTIHNQIADKLKLSFFSYFHYNPSDAEVASWQNSLRAISSVFQYSNLLDHGLILEYQLPQSSKRLDCLVCGKDATESDNAVIIELKQWSKCETTDGSNEVQTWIGGRVREVLHPSVQVGQYTTYLRDYHSAFYDSPNPVTVSGCSYLHNYPLDSSDVIYSEKFREVLSKYPLFTKDEVDRLRSFLQVRLKNGGGIDVLKRVEQSKYRPSKQLMNYIANVIEGVPEYTLLDEQLIVYDRVLSSTKEAFINAQKTVIIVEGGPGTGKSVIAINLMADLSKMSYNAHYVTGSKAFTSTLREVIGKRSSLQFRYFNDYAKAQENEVDALIADESHRLWDKTVSPN